MEKLILSKISLADLKTVVQLQEGTIASYPWTLVDSISLNDQELQQLQDIQSHL